MRLVLFDRGSHARPGAPRQVMIKLGFVYVLAGLMFAGFGVLSATDRANPRRFGNAAFWGLVALSFLAGDRLGDLGNGVLVLGVALLAGLGLLGRGQPATTIGRSSGVALSERFGNRLFLPALMLPLLVALGVLVLKPVQIAGVHFMDPKQATLISLALAAIAAVSLALILLAPAVGQSPAGGPPAGGHDRLGPPAAPVPRRPGCGFRPCRASARRSGFW